MRGNGERGGSPNLAHRIPRDLSFYVSWVFSRRKIRLVFKTGRKGMGGLVVSFSSLCAPGLVVSMTYAGGMKRVSERWDGKPCLVCSLIHPTTE